MLTRWALQNTDKRHLLTAAVGIASDAAAIAIHANRDPIEAIKLLETGRGVIAGTLFDQSDASALEKQHAELARSFKNLRRQLNALAPVGSLGSVEYLIAAGEADGLRRCMAERQLAAVLAKIRTQPGFDRFLLSASEADMLDTARCGPIIVINVSSYRRDALIIEHSGIRLLELPCLSLDAINSYARNPGSLETLEWLWDIIVEPILYDLGFTGPPLCGQWPHVWWVPTGPLARFPLHAAGYHLRRNSQTALDRVVSSYASSIKVIMHSRRGLAAAEPQSQNALSSAKHVPRQVVVVGMENTPKHGRLGFASDEVGAVLAACQRMGMQGVVPQATKRDVLLALEACTIFHFAGHGSTDPTEPLQSQLLLNDWEPEPLTVENLLAINLSSKLPFLAYLSACGTSQILDESAVDESIHLASACQLAGFRHVVGTLWSVDDGLCVDIARTMYEYLHDNGMTDESVSQGLHWATRTLRNQWVDSERPAGREESLWPGASRDVALEVTSVPKQPSWVPYVHFGT